MRSPHSSSGRNLANRHNRTPPLQEATNALRSYRKLFAPVIPGLTDTAPLHAAYEELRQNHATEQTIMLLVECQTMQEFRDAIGRMPIRHSSEWRSFSATESDPEEFNQLSQKIMNPN